MLFDIRIDTVTNWQPSIDPYGIYKGFYSQGYRFLGYMAHHFENSHIVDAGTRNGGSAWAMSINPSNVISSFDITDKYKRRFKPDNVTYILKDATTLIPEYFKDVVLVYLDISHNGDDEAVFLKNLEPHFKGVLLMDDIDCPRRWPKLNKLFLSIEREHYLIDRKIGAGRGTGLVLYGDHKVRI